MDIEKVFYDNAYGYAVAWATLDVLKDVSEEKGIPAKELSEKSAQLIGNKLERLREDPTLINLLDTTTPSVKKMAADINKAILAAIVVNEDKNRENAVKIGTLAFTSNGMCLPVELPAT